MGTNGFDFSDDATREAMGQALRMTYEVDTAMPDHLARLMQELQQRLEGQKDGATAAAVRSADSAQ
jgi:hypothetical protein